MVGYSTSGNEDGDRRFIETVSILSQVHDTSIASNQLEIENQRSQKVMPVNISEIDWERERERDNYLCGQSAFVKSFLG